MTFRQELRIAERLHHSFTNVHVQAVDNFSNYTQSVFERMRRRMLDLSITNLDRLEVTWSSDTSSAANDVRGNITALRTEAQNARVDETGFWDPV